jgi:hypothetical protein
MRAIAVSLLSAMTILAADPNTGIWKLNTAKTRYSTGQPPKDQITTIQHDGQNYVVSVNGTAPGGAPIVFRYTTPIKGGSGTVQESTVYDSVLCKRISQTVRDLKYMKSGKERMSIHAVTSEDGKTMTATVKGTDPAGNPVEGVVLYDKQ